MVEKIQFEKLELLQILTDISKEIPKEIAGYLIGGLAMIFHGTKVSTKDVDIVFTSVKDAEIFESTLIKIGFYKDTDLQVDYEKLYTRSVLKYPDGYQFDIFVNRICRALLLSKNIKNRAEEIFVKNKLKLYTVSLNDIFLFKGITNRPDDLADMAMIARSGLDWDLIEEEIQSQSEKWIWVPLYYSNLKKLEEEHGIVSPSIKRLQEEAEVFQSINLILSYLDNEELKNEDIKRILEEDDDKFIQKIIDKMNEFKLIKIVKDQIIKK